MSEAISQQYFVALNSHHLVRNLGSLTAAAIFSRAEYWFSKKVDHFYKFIEPCRHPCYRAGDSWCEELGVSRKAFRKAFELIGIRYLSKTQFDAEEDPFKGKFFAYYFDRKANKTVFVRNHKVVEAFLRTLRESLSLPLREKTLPSSESGKEKRGGEGTPPSNPSPLSGRSGNGPSDHSYARVDNISIKNKTSFSQREQKNDDFGKEVSEMSMQMRDIWIQEIGDQETPMLSPSLMTRLYQAFSRFFETSLEKWRAYCRRIASSKFLMGEGRNSSFRAWIQWAIKPEAIDRINAGEFGQDRTPERVREENATLLTLRYEREKAQRDLDALKIEFERKFRKEARDRIEEADEAQRQDWEKAFIDHLEKTDPSYAEDFRVRGWKTLLSQARFEAFMAEFLFGDVEENEEYKKDKERLEIKAFGGSSLRN